MKEICEGFAKIYHCEISLTIKDGYPAVINTPKETELAITSIKKIIGP